jgi:tetratricopeptide (TPR) repeat protein
MLKKIYVIFGILFCAGLLLVSGCSTVKIAEVKMQQENYAEAIPLYQQHLAKNPDEFRIKSRLGFAYLKTGQLDAAIKTFEEVLAVAPGDPYSVLYLGLAYLNKEETGKAVTLWQGYKNQNEPAVEAEIRRFLTLLQIADSQRKASQALAQEQSLMAAAPDAETYAVCYYDDLSPDKSLGAFQKALAAMVITDLSKIKSVKVVERIQMQALLEEMKLGQTGVVDAATAPRLGKLLKAENLITGSLSLGSIQATTVLTSSSKGAVKASVTTSVEQENFYELPMNIVHGVAKALNIQLSPEESAAIGTPHTTNYKAFIYFGEALNALDAGDWTKAKDLFAKAAAEDPKFEMAKKWQDACPEIWLPRISELKNMKGNQLSNQAEKAAETARTAQKEERELVNPREESEKIKTPEKPETPEVRVEPPEKPRYPDQPLQESPQFPDPPR